MTFSFEDSQQFKRIADALERIAKVMEERPGPIIPMKADDPRIPSLAEAVRKAVW